MGIFDELKDKGETLAADHPEQLEKASDAAIERGGDTADRVSHGRHVKQVDDLQEKADGAIGSHNA